MSGCLEKSRKNWHVWKTCLQLNLTETNGECNKKLHARVALRTCKLNNTVFK